MKKIVSIVGARPQFIKAAVLSRCLRKEFEEVLVHTGQHYDYNMSEIFFKELEIPTPNYNLGISGGTHGKMTGEMIIAIEEVLYKEKPDMVLLYGDTNSTMAGALAAVKMHIPIIHVEAGNRIGEFANPEEINRVVTDHVSSLLMCCTESAKEFLVREGLGDKAFVVGDPMYDAFLYYSKKIANNVPEKLIGLDDNTIELPKKLYYLTCHREENTSDDEALTEILAAMNSLDEKCIYPVHPRNHDRVIRLQSKYKYNNIIFCKPVGYLMSVFLLNHAEKIITDSGGLQREAYFAKKPCVTVLNHVAWPETMNNDRNQLAKPKKEDILSKLSKNISFDQDINQFGDGNSAEKILEIIKETL